MIVGFIKGIIVGLLASIPLGPIGVLCIQRTVSRGKNAGIFTGMGAAVCDTFFAAIAVLSLHLIIDFMTTYEDWVMTIGGIIVVTFGAKLFTVNPVKLISRNDNKAKKLRSKYVGDFFSSALMTFTNPGALLLMFGMMTLMRIETAENAAQGLIALTIIGVFIGSSIWWVTLSSVINHFRQKFRLRQLLMINRICGIIVIVLGVLSFCKGSLLLIEHYLS